MIKIFMKNIKIKLLMIIYCLLVALPYVYADCIEGNCTNGQGTFTWPNGDKYVGGWQNGSQTGQGIYTWSNGDKYVGGWQNGKRSGQGTFTSHNGNTYVGQFRNGYRNGQGTFTWINGNKYVGQFKDGKQTGQGTFTWINGDMYIGQWQNGNLDGSGSISWADGVTYEGNFVDGYPQPPHDLLLNGIKRPGKITVQVVIYKTSDNSQAQSIGLQNGDVIVEYNKDTVLNHAILTHLLSKTKPEENVSMIIKRHGKNLNFSLKGGKIGIFVQDQYSYTMQDQAQRQSKKTTVIEPYKTEAFKEAVITAKLDSATKTALGRYYALVIGNNNYLSFPKLKTAKNDAQAISTILKNNYGFNVTLLLDAKRSDILMQLAKFRERLSGKDNLLIYYAGHGFLDKEGDEGYWLPVDATKDSEVNWISNSSITTQLKALGAKHVLIIADSCYSGKLGRDVHITKRTPDYYLRIAQKRARSVIASGGLEPVIDSGGKGNHSVFSSAFINALQDNKSIIDASELFSRIRRPVVLNADQTPEYADIRKAGHEGGEFIFVREK